MTDKGLARKGAEKVLKMHVDSFVENWLGTSGGQKGVWAPPDRLQGAAKTLEGEVLWMTRRSSGRGGVVRGSC